MIIRKATSYDPYILEGIARSVSVDRNTEKASGLIELNLNRDSYEKRTHGNNFAFIAENGKRRSVGFMIGYHSDFLNRLTEMDEHAASDDIMRLLYDFPKPFLYCEQLAVLPDFSGRGIATALYDRTLKEMEKRSLKVLYAAVAHTPWKNKDSIDFIKKRDHVLVDEVTTMTGLVFGIYEKNL